MKKSILFLSVFLLSVFLILSGCAEKNEQQANESGVAQDDGASQEDGTSQDEKKQVEQAGDSAEQVVTINEKTFTKDDLAFYTLMKKIEIEKYRSADQQQLSDEQLEDQEAYWDEQLSYFDEMNVQLQNMIEIYAMALLAEEKHYFIPDDDLQAAMDKFHADNGEVEAVQQLIADYGEKKYNRSVSEYLRQSLLRDRVINDLKDDIKIKDTKISEQEMNFELSKNYEELYMDQVKSLDLTIHIKE